MKVHECRFPLNSPVFCLLDFSTCPSLMDPLRIVTKSAVSGTAFIWRNQNLCLHVVRRWTSLRERDLTSECSQILTRLSTSMFMVHSLPLRITCMCTMEFLVKESTKPKMYLPCFQLLHSLKKETPRLFICKCILKLTYPPTKGNNGLSLVWYLPLHAGTVLLWQVLCRTCTLGAYGQKLQ